MNRNDKGWVAEKMHDLDREIRAEVERRIDNAIANHLAARHCTQFIIGACGQCGGAVVVGKAGDGHVLYGDHSLSGYVTTHTLPRCLKCGAEAANVIPMKERRKEEAR